MSTCRSCGKPIEWATTISGKKMPLDANPHSAGNIVIREGIAHYLKAGEEIPAGTPRRVSHFATCPNSEKHRRKEGSANG